MEREPTKCVNSDKTENMNKIFKNVMFSSCHIIGQMTTLRCCDNLLESFSLHCDGNERGSYTPVNMIKL